MSYGVNSFGNSSFGASSNTLSESSMNITAADTIFSSSATGQASEGAFNISTDAAIFAGSGISLTPNSISIVSPQQYRLIRRGNNATVTIPVTVAYSGSPEYIEIQWNGHGWQQFVPTGSPQVCNLTGNPRGFGTLEVRFSNDISTNASVSPIAVGKAIVGAGQSNMDGRGSSNQAAPANGAYLFDSSGNFHPLIDPWAGLPYGGTATYSVLDDLGSSAGSYVPRLAQKYIDAGEPTLWIPCAKGSTSITQWNRDLSTSTLYGALKARVDAAGGADIIIWHQGENEAFGTPSQSAYETNLSNLVANFASDFNNPVVVVQKIHTMAGYETGCATIRAAQENVISAGLNGIKRGADLNGITTAVHFTTSPQLTSVADLTFAAIEQTAAGFDVILDSVALSFGAKSQGIGNFNFQFDDIVMSGNYYSSPHSAFMVSLDDAQINLNAFGGTAGQYNIALEDSIFAGNVESITSSANYNIEFVDTTLNSSANVSAMAEFNFSTENNISSYSVSVNNVEYDINKSYVVFYKKHSNFIFAKERQNIIKAKINIYDITRTGFKNVITP